jgi:hypothetical protein
LDNVDKEITISVFDPCNIDKEAILPPPPKSVGRSNSNITMDYIPPLPKENIPKSEDIPPLPDDSVPKSVDIPPLPELKSPPLKSTPPLPEN